MSWISADMATQPRFLAPKTSSFFGTVLACISFIIHIKNNQMDNEKKVTTETTSTDHSGEGGTRTEHTEKTVTTENVEPKPKPVVTETVTVTEHRETTED